MLFLSMSVTSKAVELLLPKPKTVRKHQRHHHYLRNLFQIAQCYQNAIYAFIWQEVKKARRVKKPSSVPLKSNLDKLSPKYDTSHVPMIHGSLIAFEKDQHQV